MKQIASDQCEEAFQRGFRHGQNKTVPILKKLERAETELHRLRAKYRSEIGSYRAYIARLREIVSPELFRECMQEKHPPRPSTRPINEL